VINEKQNNSCFTLDTNPDEMRSKFADAASVTIFSDVPCLRQINSVLAHNFYLTVSHSIHGKILVLMEKATTTAITTTNTTTTTITTTIITAAITQPMTFRTITTITATTVATMTTITTITTVLLQLQQQKLLLQHLLFVQLLLQQIL